MKKETQLISIEINRGKLSVVLFPYVRNPELPAQDSLKQFLKEYQVQDALRYSPAQLDVFKDYFLAYIISKSYYQISAALNNPGAAHVKALPVINRIYQLFDTLNQRGDKASTESLEKANRKRALLHDDPTRTYLDFLVNSDTADVYAIIDRFRDQNCALPEKALEDLSSEVGNGDRIRHDANFLSTTWVEVFRKSKKTKDAAVLPALESRKPPEAPSETEIWNI